MPSLAPPLASRPLRWALGVLLSLSVSAGCEDSSEDRGGSAKASTAGQPSETAQPKNSKPSRDAPKAPLLKRRREIMSTWFELSLSGADAERGAAALEAGLTEIERLEGVLSEWRPETEISRVNRAAGNGEWIPLGKESLDVVQAGLNVSVWSRGAYDLSWAALRGLYRFDGSKRVPSPDEIQQRLSLVGFRDIELSREPPKVRLRREGMAIGTGGIAKGYALDRVAELLEERGFDDYLLFAGGQVQVKGSRGGRAWRIGIQHPRDRGDYVAFLELEAGSVSTSGDYEHYFVADGKLWHHILDLSTGYPARRSVSVTLVAPDGVYADALSTACFVLGADGCFTMLSELPFTAEAVVIDPSMRVHISPGLQGKVVFTPPLVDGKLPPSRAP